MGTFLRLLVIVPLLAFALGGAAGAPAAAPGWTAKVDEWVLSHNSQGAVEFLVSMGEQADLSAAGRLKTKQEKGSYVYSQLTSTARRTQRPILDLLESRSLEGSRAIAYRPYWVANVIWVHGDLALVEELARRPEVKRIHGNPSTQLEAPPPSAPDEGPLTPLLAPDSITWNLTLIHAPDLWGLGVTGENVVVGGADTGYKWDHPALEKQYRGYDPLTPEHDYNWHDAIHQDDPHTSPGNLKCGFNSTAPCDDFGHGTHTMGIMVGHDEQTGLHIGVAPDAKWIGCRNMEQGWGTPATYIECYQWFIAPWPHGGDPFTDGDPSKAPDVINNSWSCPEEEGCTNPNVLKTAVESVRAAGILTVHSAGNSGSSCGTVNTPAAIYEASFSVGNTDQFDNIAGSSSRGPVTVDLSGRLKPDVSAPGTDIYSSYTDTLYRYWSGTSMSGPHVAGLAALLIDAKPALSGQVNALESMIEQGAVPLAPTFQICGLIPDSQVPNNTYGWGRVDALGAHQAHALALDKTSTPILINPGEVFTYTIDLTHAAMVTPTTNIVLTDTLPVNTSFITATLPYTLDGNTIRWDFTSLDAMETTVVELVVQASLAMTETITNHDYAARSDDVPLTWGPEVGTWRIEGVQFLPIILR